MTRSLLVAAVFTGAAVLVGSLSAQAVSTARQPAVAADHSAVSVELHVAPIGSSAGGDVSIGAIQSVQHWTPGGPVMRQRAYSFGATLCNIGDIPMTSEAGTPNNFLITENLYRLHDGRLEQIGQNWVYHLFCTLQQSLCTTCQSTCGGCCNALGVGCSDPTTATRAGTVSLLGPRGEVNPVTAAFLPIYVIPQGPTAIRGRIQAAESDLLSTQFPSARYFIEAFSLMPQDAQVANNSNNASWREVSINQVSFATTLLSTGSGAPGGTVGGTNREEVALFAWQEFDADSGPQPSVGVTISAADVPADGRFILGYEVTNNDDGTWTYEYALLNYNSDRAAQSFSIPLAPDVSVTGIGFHDVDYHSYDADNGSQYDLADWSADRDGGAITWSGAPFSENPNANALRWGTLYNFRFTANTAPQPANATITLFKPGSPTQINVMTHGPQPGPFCAADFDGSGAVDGIDLGILLAQFFGPGSADLNASGVVDGVDLGILLSQWGDC